MSEDCLDEMVSLTELTPAKLNARTHSKKQIRQLAQSLKRFGWTNPVLIDERGVILAGHGRVEAARSLGIERVPCRRMSSMTEADKRAYAIADNQLALTAGWDFEILADELVHLRAEDYDVEVTGFEPVEVAWRAPISEVSSCVVTASSSASGNEIADLNVYWPRATR